jgi:putative transposase
MKRSRFTDEQIAYALRQVDGGTAVADVCRQMGISEATFYVWKKKHANLGSTEIRELRPLREENAKLKRLLADLSLERGWFAVSDILMGEGRKEVANEVWRFLDGMPPAMTERELIAKDLRARVRDARTRDGPVQTPRSY